VFSSPRLSSPHKLFRGVSLPAFAILCLLAFAASVSAQTLSIPGIKAPDKKKDPARLEMPVQLKAALGLAPLGRLHDGLKVEASKIRRLPALSEREIQDAGPSKRVRVGTVRSFERPPDFSSDSVLYNVAEGEVRVMGLVSEGALYTRVHFTNMSLPAGARVFVYSIKNPEEFYGPYEGRGASEDGTFWTPPMEGDGVVIEYFSPTGTISENAPFQVSEVSHVYRSLFEKESLEKTAGACNLDVTGDWAEVAKSVGRLQFTSGGGEYLCTGTLLNNQANDLTPNLLTANHCISTKAEAQSLRVYWNYNSGEIPFGTPRTDGANLLATGTTSDYTLVRLTGSLPGGLFYAGWDASSTPLSTPITGIHHPQGSYKRISFGSTISGCEPGLPGPCANFINARWNSGTTEPGSSGSGIWRGTPSDARLVGTLMGGYASCSNLSGTDFYGRFSVTYQRIASFLTGGGGSGGSCTATPITPNTGGVTGTLSSSDCNSPRRPGSFADQYTFQGSTGQKLEIMMTASFDTYIYLIGPNGVVIAANDDDPGMGGTNSRIGLTTLTLPSNGTYTIEATSYAPGATGGYSLSFILQDAPTGPRFSQSTYNFNEGDGRATLVVTRTANTSSTETVSYYTSDSSGLNECSKVTGNASSRCDYATSFGTLQFAPGETAKTLWIPLVDDSLIDGAESFFIFLSSAGGSGPSPGGDLGRSTVTILDNDSSEGANPINQTPFFIRQHYVDFLGREPDPTGYAGWQDILNKCPAGDTRCDRIEVSSAFFRSPEFQERGYFIYRFDAAILGTIPRYINFNSALSRVSGFLSAEQLEAAKASYARDYLFNLDFMRLYGGISDARQFVDAISTRAGVTLASKEQLISDMATGKKTKDQVMRAIVESPEVYQKFYNEAFVVMQYFGFLRRDPDILYLEWIKTMNQTGDYRAMINGFMNSQEYRQRFGP
jgi:Calx-beta domain/Bacterial pre-peptidase C-terminal domain/Domain of unknown function (DUF4214)